MPGSSSLTARRSGSDSAARIARRLQDDVGARFRIVPVGDVGLDHVRAARAADLHVGDDADDRHPRGLVAAEADAAADRLLVRARTAWPSASLTTSVGSASRSAKTPSALQRDLHRREIVRADDAIPGDEGVGAARRRRASFDQEVGVVVAGERQHGGERGLLSRRAARPCGRARRRRRRGAARPSCRSRAPGGRSR